MTESERIHRTPIHQPTPAGGEALASDGRNAAQRPIRVGTQVVLDLEMPHIEIASALARRDEAAIWRQLSASGDQASYLRQLACLAERVATQQPHFRESSRMTTWHETLVAIPCVLPAAARRMEGGGGDLQVMSGIRCCLLELFPGYQQVRLYSRMSDYAEIACWSPLTVRESLDELASRALPPERAALLPRVAEPEPKVARLCFVVGSIWGWLQEPQLPPPLDPAAQWRLRSRLAGYLSLGCEAHIAAQHVLPPMCFHEAIDCGLQMWVRALADDGLVRDWRVQPGLHDQVLLELGLAHGLQDLSVPLRLHQIGGEGMQQLTDSLAAAAPCRAGGLPCH